MLNKQLQELLLEKNLKLPDFQAVVQRLFAYGIILRAEGGVEERVYDDATRMSEILEDYFSLGGFRLVHDFRNFYFRLYPPGADIPGAQPDEQEPVPSLRARLSSDFVATTLTLRLLYQQGLQEASSRLTDSGEVMVRLEDISAAMQANLRRSLPEGAMERRTVLNDLRRHRIVSFSGNFDINDEEAFIAIRPTILGVLSEDALLSAMEGAGIVEDQVETENIEGDA